ncbi:MAG: discoidin domain-containing protein, partial [Phycisphaerae bacterium]|nr:discoidin domain-containing protein [Phycisphaerae bacterium]
GIAVGTEATYTYDWTWNANDYAGDTDPHCKSRDHRDRVITFEVERDDRFDEQSLNNNSLSDFLEAPGMGYYVEQSMYDMFNTTKNQVGTYSFEDWIQWHVRVWNESYMEMSRFAGFAEDGGRERVRIQKIEVVPDGMLCVGGNHNVNCTSDYLLDGEWGFRPDQSYVDKWSLLIEWGLLHECTHQLGMIDLYTMNMEAGTPTAPMKVQVKDGTSHYITRGYYPAFGGLMGGGDTRYSEDYEGTGLLSAWTAGALSSSTGYRRGFYGEQVYDVPDTVRLRALDAAGNPIPLAEFKVWQSRSGATPDESLYDWQPIFEGSANANGIVTLPNYGTLEAGPFTTITGHTLKDNPWGRTNVVGSNGSLLVKITGYGQKDYTFMRISQVNEASWSGATSEYTHDLPVHIAPASNLGAVNIAVGATATASGGIPAYAVDGDLETRWDPGNAQSGSYLEVDLGDVHDVALVTLVQNGWAADFFEQFSIETSLTGAFAGEQTLFAHESIGWGMAVGTRRDIDPQDEDIYRVTYANAPTPTRYLRITCEMAHWTKLAELELYPDLGGSDATPPAQITDLSADDVAATAASLSWTTPGDDGWDGTATALDIRYADSAITAANFDSAWPVPDVPAPWPGGSVQNHLLTDLTPDTRYWVAMMARDEIPNWSPLSNVVTFTTPSDAVNLEFTTLTTPVDTSFASGLASDGQTLYYLRRDTGQFYRSSTGGESWSTLPSTELGMGGWHGDWTSGILAYAPNVGYAGGITATRRDTDNIQKVIYYDIAGGYWIWTDTYPCFSHGTTVVGGYLYGVAHAVGGNYGGPINRVDLTNLTLELADRTLLWPIVGDSTDWFSRAALLTTTGGWVYGIKNDWATPAGTGDRVYGFDPNDFDASVFTGSGSAEWWDDTKWQCHTTETTDLGQIPFEVGYGSAVVGLPPNWTSGIGSKGGLFIVAGRSPSNNEGWGDASDQFAILDVATRTFLVGTLPGVTGSGGSAAFHDGS